MWEVSRSELRERRETVTSAFDPASVGLWSGRGFLPEPRKHIAESLPEVTEGRRSAMWEVSRSELRECRETVTSAFDPASVGLWSGRGFLPEPRKHIAESLPEVTEGRRSAMWEVSRSELRECRETVTSAFDPASVGLWSGRGFLPEPRKHIAESLPEVTEG